jgi:predicted nuclease with TOPRIM domain
MLEKFFDELDSAIGNGKTNSATLRNMLQSLREQAEAVEMEVRKLNAEAHSYKRRIEELEKQVGDPDKVDELGLRFLKVLFDRADGLSIEQITQALDLPKAKIAHCCDVLLEKKMIEKAGEGRSGYSGHSRFEDWRSDYFGLTAKGRKYVAEGS